MTTANSTIRTCDIVMKGGITSGVVYPRAVAKLASRFRFKNIGGTSAGAIAAAVTAAAEYRRAVGNGADDTGFADIAKLGPLLASRRGGSKNTVLFSLFAPNRSTRKLFRVIVGSVGHDSMVWTVCSFLLGCVTQFRIATLVGLMPGTVLAVFSLYATPRTMLSWTWIIVGIALAMAGGLIGSIAKLTYDFVERTTANYFGLCSGMPDPGARSTPVEPLTLWLDTYIKKIAGLADTDPPLVFGQLWNPTQSAAIAPEREINLEMMTTNLTHGRPYRLPFRNDEDLKENLFYFNKNEFEQLFPKSVVDWMVNHPRQMPAGDAKRAAARADAKARGLYPMPDPENQPVIVATRMSLSFPILLSAIPLWSIDRTKDEQYQVLERCWFTDGGVCSNFPIHFFDSPLPKRPTFSIDLVERPDDTPPGQLLPEMDESNQPTLMDRWNRFDLNVSSDESVPPKKKGGLGQLSGFAGTLLSTMQNWNDAVQGRLPGYRDRIVRIPLTSKQGGLNLDMPPTTVKFLTDQGDKCADQLISHFDVPSVQTTMNWDNHRWIRLRSMLAALEKMTNDALSAANIPENHDVSYGDWLRELDGGKSSTPSYHATKAQITAACQTLQKLAELQQIWTVTEGAAEDSPRPRPWLRPRPQI